MGNKFGFTPGEMQSIVATASDRPNSEPNLRDQPLPGVSND